LLKEKVTVDFLNTTKFYAAQLGNHRNVKMIYSKCQLDCKGK